MCVPQRHFRPSSACLISASRRLLLVAQEGGGGHDPAVDAVAALRAPAPRRRRSAADAASRACRALTSVTTLALPTAETGVMQERIGCAVEMHGAGAALRQPAAELRIVQPDVVAQRVEQRHVRIGVDRVRLAVHVEGYSGHGCMSPDLLDDRVATIVCGCAPLLRIIPIRRLVQRGQRWKHASGGESDDPGGVASARTEASEQITHLLLGNIAGDEHQAGWCDPRPARRRVRPADARRCCTTCTSTGPRQPATLRKPLTRSRSGPRSAISVSMARANTVPRQAARRRSSTKLTMPSLCSASATKPEWPARVSCSASASIRQRGSISPATAVSMAARGLSVAQPFGQPLDRRRLGEVGLRDHQPVGEDRLLARLRRPFERLAAPPTASTTATTTSTKNSPPSARSVENVCRIGPGSASPLVSITIRPNCGTAPRSRSATRWRSAICRSERVLQHRQPLPSSVISSALSRNERVVDADGAELVDDDGGVLAFRRRQEAAHQRGLAGAEKAGDDRHRDARRRARASAAARTGRPRAREEIEQGVSRLAGRPMSLPQSRCAPSPHLGRGSGEGVRSLSIDLNPSPHPSPYGRGSRPSLSPEHGPHDRREYGPIRTPSPAHRARRRGGRPCRRSRARRRTRR